MRRWEYPTPNSPPTVTMCDQLACQTERKWKYEKKKINNNNNNSKKNDIHKSSAVGGGQTAAEDRGHCHSGSLQLERVGLRLVNRVNQVNQVNKGLFEWIPVFNGCRWLLAVFLSNRPSMPWKALTSLLIANWNRS